MTPGQLVRRARKQRGVTQAQLAVRAGTTQSAISRVESDLVSPTVDHLARLLACLGAELRLGAEPMSTWTDRDELLRWQALDSSERLNAAVGTLDQLGEIVGAARDR